MIYHEEKTLEYLRLAIDDALTAYLTARGLSTDEMTEANYSEFDESIENIVNTAEMNR